MALRQLLSLESRRDTVERVLQVHLQEEDGHSGNEGRKMLQ